MALSVFDTRGEFKLGELVGWGRQLDAAAASTLPIVNTTLQAEVLTISRQV